MKELYNLLGIDSRIVSNPLVEQIINSTISVALKQYAQDNQMLSLFYEAKNISDGRTNFAKSQYKDQILEVLQSTSIKTTDEINDDLNNRNTNISSSVSYSGIRVNGDGSVDIQQYLLEHDHFPDMYFQSNFAIKEDSQEIIETRTSGSRPENAKQEALKSYVIMEQERDDDSREDDDYPEL